LRAEHSEVNNPRDIVWTDSILIELNQRKKYKLQLASLLSGYHRNLDQPVLLWPHELGHTQQLCHISQIASTPDLVTSKDISTYWWSVDLAIFDWPCDWWQHVRAIDLLVLLVLSRLLIYL